MVFDNAEPPFREYTVSGQALETRGLVGNNTVDYVGLLVFGLMWGCASLWSPSVGDLVTSTTWTAAAPSVSTTWTDATPAVTTTWTDFLYDNNAADLFC